MAFLFAIGNMASAWNLDATFNGTGIGEGTFGGTGQAVAVQDDGKILVARSYPAGDGEAILARFTTDGKLDTAFNNSGWAAAPTSQLAEGFAVALQKDGRILVAGSSEHAFVLVRYLEDGTLDASFNGTGVCMTQIGNRGEARGVAVQPDGMIVVVGTAQEGSWKDNVIVARYTTDGVLDPEFNNSGIVSTSLRSDAHDVGRAVVLQADGKIIVCGSSTVGTTGYHAVVRYNPDGTLDPTFNGNGFVLSYLGYLGGTADVALQSDGKIVVVGDVNDDFALARFNPDGSLDTTFNGSGTLITDVGGVDSASSVVLLHDGRILVAGSSWATKKRFAFARYLPDGSLDQAFNSNGKLTTEIEAGAYILDIALQGDGKVVAVGGRQLVPNAGPAFTVTRHNGIPPGQMGRLQVHIGPVDSAAAGAQWRLDGGRWRNSGALLQWVPVGAHQISFKPAVNWTAPLPLNVTVGANLITVATGTYSVQTGTLQVTLGPSDALTAKAQWRLDDGTWQKSGTLLRNVSAGEHAVSFKTITGFHTPSELSVRIQPDQATKLEETYHPTILSSGAGLYTGLILNEAGDYERTGYFSIVFDRTGLPATKPPPSILIGGKSYSLRGNFEADGILNGVLETPGGPTLGVRLEMDGGGELAGSIFVGENLLATISGSRAAWNAKTNSAPQAGTYTMLLNPDEGSESVGIGYATIAVSAAGLISVTGVLPDGSRFLQTSILSPDGRWRLYAPLSQSGGALVGEIVFRDVPQVSDMDGVVTWYRPAQGQTVASNDEKTILAAIGSRYRVPRKGYRVIEFANVIGNVRFTAGQDSVTAIERIVTVDSYNRATVMADNPEGLTLIVNTRTGGFTGRFQTTGGLPATFDGVLLQKQNLGAGYFREAAASGWILLAPNPRFGIQPASGGSNGDLLAPKLRITAPKSMTRFNGSASVIVEGTASDTAGVVTVQYQILHDGEISEVLVAQGTSTWSIPLQLQPDDSGPFSVFVKAVDINGNESPMVSTTFISVPVALP